MSRLKELDQFEDIEGIGKFRGGNRLGVQVRSADRQRKNKWKGYNEQTNRMWQRTLEQRLSQRVQK